MRIHNFLLFGIAILLFTCKNESHPIPEASNTSSPPTEKSGQAFITDDESKPNVLQIAMGSKDHTTLTAAVQAADLENALVNAGPLTVFAPTNEAFDALPDGTVESILKPENKNKLADISKYHLAPGNYKKDFLKNFKKLGMANNQNAMIKVEEDNVYIGEAKIIGSISAGNGFVHVIDKVIIPPTK